jgi:hypothetical protein
MFMWRELSWKYGWTSATWCAVVVAMSTFLAPVAQAAAADNEITYTKDIAPILQRSCENCHRADGVAPMALSTYDQVRPWARAIKQRTSIGPRAGVMPPWYVEKNIGIQEYQNDPSLGDEEIAMIGKWADAGAPRGNPADMPAPKQYVDGKSWTIGTPDLVVKLPEVTVKGNAPDWWGEIPSTPTGLTEDRYVAALEIKEFNDVDTGGNGRQTVGGRFVVHHMIWSTSLVAPGQSGPPPVGATLAWPVHEVGRNADLFDPRSAKLLKAGSSVVSDSVHLHSNGRDTKAHLEIGFKFMPKDYKPMYRQALIALGNGVDIDIKGMTADQQLHAYAVLQENTKIVSFEPHLHAPGQRMCLEAIWGYNIQTLSCVGYDHNWVRGYSYKDDYAPLLPKGTILHIIGYMNNSASNKNVPDPRNWQGSGNRSVANMFIDLGQRVSLSDEQFREEMARRRSKLHLTRNDNLIGCPLCTVETPSSPAAATQSQNQQPQ